MNYEFRDIEEKWKKKWKELMPFKASNDSELPKYYVLDMFPYPSGAGLHVGHPLGYIASDIIARYKRLKGFNVLHPMGYDSFGLPAEQYAIQTGQHPAITTTENTARYREQLDDIGFSFDWSRQVMTSDSGYYRWTQWIFIQLFNSWYNKETNKAESINSLINVFGRNGNKHVVAETSYTKVFKAEEWQRMSEEDQQLILQEYRLTYLSESVVNWCPELGTVLANDEVKDGVSERGGYPVEQKKMKQWSMRITAYAERLLKDLETVNWTESIKVQQQNWIGKSTGAMVDFKVFDTIYKIKIFTTRPDTIFGATFMVLAPEHSLVKEITTENFRKEVEEYQNETKKRSERDRMSDTKHITGCFTGAYAVHPFSGKRIPIWIADYVLAGYGTGAVMAVPAGDQRDMNFATKYGLEVITVVEGTNFDVGANESKTGILINSDFLNGLEVNQAIKTAIHAIKEKGIGHESTNYKIRDAVFSRQRYWGEPIPVYYKNGIPYVLDENELPLELPEVDEYLPTKEGDPPLARAKDWKTKEGYSLETNTMPGWAGSSWYMFRYMNPDNDKEIVSKEAASYWQNVDLYIGGSEHATGHLLYSRFWTKFLYDIEKISVKEPFQKMINQGMIVYFSAQPQVNKQGGVFLDAEDWEMFNKYNANPQDPKIDRIRLEKNQNLLKELKLKISDFRDTIIPVEVLANSGRNLAEEQYGLVKVADLTNNLEEYATFKFIKNGEFLEDEEMLNVQLVLDKMSKSKFNVVNPDDLINFYGADTLRCYEMFLGPLEESKVWNTKGIEGVSRFLKKFWRMFYNEDKLMVSEEEPSKEMYKSLHRTIKKVTDDIERYSFNTVVSELMICVNEMNELKCNHRVILEPLVILLSPYAPFIAEELWEKLGHEGGIRTARFPTFDESYLVEDTHKYPISFNGKMRFTVELATTMDKNAIENEVMAMDDTKKWLDGKKPKKVIVVPKKIVNIVV